MQPVDQIDIFDIQADIQYRVHVKCGILMFSKSLEIKWFSIDQKLQFPLPRTVRMPNVSS